MIFYLLQLILILKGGLLWDYQKKIYQKGFNEQTITKDNIFLIWLQGGPGCSSQSTFYELIGPFHIEKSDAEFTIQKKDNSWNDFASILFVDRPFELDLAKGIYQLIQHCKLQVILQNLWLNSSRFLPNSNWLKLTLLDSVTQVTLLLYFRIVCLIVTSSLIIKDLQLKMDYKVCYIELRQYPHTYM
ncbi:unnamed protein product [Paramecium octaurelia]|uniref:Uncharacterized protein n=1 Tax=Paramecium octaurelia TaxID=43137 RepID=A0A8S1YPB6_PAROT|nr:unnamed protein product [Paramecium octaurelia]